MYALYRAADRREQSGKVDHTSRIAGLANLITGRY
jgi:hypothetical protein